MPVLPGSREIFVSDKHDDQNADPDTWDHHDDTADPDQNDHSDHYGDDDGFGYAAGAAAAPAKPWSTASAATGFKSRIETFDASDAQQRMQANAGVCITNENHKEQETQRILAHVSADSAKKPGAGFGSVSSSKRHKYALLIGCNYPGTQAALAGCVNDVHVVREMLLAYFGEAATLCRLIHDTCYEAVEDERANTLF
eukprot:365811-Chlamydomonas_euryale.AAC.14